MSGNQNFIINTLFTIKSYTYVKISYQ